MGAARDEFSFGHTGQADQDERPAEAGRENEYKEKFLELVVGIAQQTGKLDRLSLRQQIVVMKVKAFETPTQMEFLENQMIVTPGAKVVVKVRCQGHTYSGTCCSRNAEPGEPAMLAAQVEAASGASAEIEFDGLSCGFAGSKDQRNCASLPQ